MANPEQHPAFAEFFIKQGEGVHAHHIEGALQPDGLVAVSGLALANVVKQYGLDATFLVPRTVDKTPDVQSFLNDQITIRRYDETVFLRDDILPLTAQEYALLDYFFRTQGTYSTRDRIYTSAWPTELHAYGIPSYNVLRTVDQHVARVRRKIDPVLFAGASKASIITSRRSLGYGFIPAEIAR